jgi:hypothetical protein
MGSLYLSISSQVHHHQIHGKIQAYNPLGAYLELALLNLDDHLHLMSSSYGLFEIFLLMQAHEYHLTHIDITNS